MPYTINWSKSAENDYIGIIDYLLQNWPVSAAENFMEITENKIQILRIFDVRQDPLKLQF